jgi:phage minor structural protein
MAMIKIFNATDTDFKTAGNIIINPLHCHEIKKKSLNGWYIEVEIPIKYKEYIEADKLCVVKTKSKLKPQAFRINDSITYTNRKIKFTAEHVMFDSRRYVLLDVRPTNLNGQNGLKYVNERTDKTSPFSIDSNVENVSTAYFIRKTLLESWQVFEERWGGVFEADNWDISFKQSIGKDNGETIVYGKNMQGFEIFEDWSNVCTKILPVGYDGLLLPEIYLESETQYEISYTKIVDFQTDLEAEEQTETNLLLELRNNASKYLEENCVPKVSYTVNSNVNNDLEIGDTIKVLHPFVNIFTEVLEYEYDLISEKVKSLTFGNYTRDVKTKFNNIKNTIETIKQTVSKQEITIKKQTNLINSLNKNGYVYIDDNEILILDKLPKEQAKNVWRFGLGGIGFSSKGYEGPFETAITMDGQINAKFITTGTMAVARIEGLANFITETSSSITKIELEQGRITSKVSSVEQSIESITKIEGTAEGKNIYIDDASAEPLIDIMLEGESQQGASPSPDNLSKIENLEGKNKVKEINWKQMPSISTGATITNVNGYGTDYIDVDNTKQYIFSYLGTSGSKYIVYYDKDKNFLGYDTEIQINNFAKWNETGYVRLRIDCPQGSVTAFQLEEGTVATGYVPYNSLEIKDVGKNLYAGNEITINGTYSSNTSVNLGSRYLSEGTYTISLTNSLPNNSYIYLGANGSIATAIRNKATFTLTEEQNVPMRLVVKAGTYSNFTTKIMIEKGMVVTDYEPHQQQTEYFPLSEGQKLYKNSYLVDDGIHHSRKQVVLDGTETGWYTLANQTGTNTSYFCIPKSDMKKASTLICDKFINRNVWNTDEEGIQSIIDNLIRLRINTSRASTVAELKTWLSNNHIRVEYELAEEEIVPYTEDQKEAWEKLRHFTLFRGINNITSTANAKITYVRDNGLNNTYETKRNVKENYYTKSETDSQISQTADSIKESVKAINEQTQEKLATLELANQSLEFATRRVGGNNLIRNSAMINDNNFWLAHAKYPYQESDTPPDNPTEGAYWYCTANSGSYIENQMYVYNSGWQVSELSRKSLLSAQNYFAYTTSNEYWANGKNANENTLSGRVIKLDGRQDYTVSHIFNITEPITLNQNENKMAISHFIKNSIVQGNVCVGLMFLNEADFTEVEKPYSLYEPGIILTPDDLKDLTKIEQIIEIPKKSDFIPVVVSNTAPTDTTKNWLDTTIYLPKKYNSQTSQWEILDTKMSLYNESSREVWTYRYFYGFYYQTPIIYDTAEIKSCYVALTFYPAFAVYTGNVEPTPYKGLYWNNKTTNLVKRAKYNNTTFVEWETLDIPSSLLPTGASLGVELFDYIVPIKGFVEIADLKLEYNTMCTQWTQFPGEVYGKNYKMDEKGFWIQANQNTMFIDEDEILATYKGINIFQINKDLAYFYKIQATESIEIGNYFLKTQQINSKNMLLLY